MSKAPGPEVVCPGVIVPRYRNSTLCHQRKRENSGFFFRNLSTAWKPLRGRLLQPLVVGVQEGLFRARSPLRAGGDPAKQIGPWRPLPDASETMRCEILRVSYATYRLNPTYTATAMAPLRRARATRRSHPSSVEDSPSVRAPPP